MPLEKTNSVDNSKSDVNFYIELVSKYFPEIYSFIHNRLAIPSVSQEVTEAVFSAVISELGPVKNFNKTRILLYQLADHEVINYLEDHELDDSEIARFECDETQQFIVILLQTLEENMQNMITLKFYTDLTNSEIAEVLKVDSAKLKNLMQQALEAFKKAHIKFNPEDKNFDFS